jgi:hypothetical protein
MQETSKQQAKFYPTTRRFTSEIRALHRSTIFTFGLAKNAARGPDYIVIVFQL